MVSKIQIVQVPLSDIVPYHNNPRHNAAAVEAVKTSIETFGFLVPMVLDEHNVIVTGHTRYAAATELKLKTVPVIYARNLSAEQLRAFRVVDNKTSELAGWDQEKLLTELSALTDSGFDFDAMGFAEDETLARAVAQDKAPAMSEADMPKRMTAVTKAPKSVRISIGDIRFHVPIKFYENWLHELRQSNGADDQRVVAALAKRLRLEYELPPGAKSSTPVHSPTAAKVRTRTKAPAKPARKR